MKKRLAALLLSVAVMVCTVLPAAAENPTSSITDLSYTVTSVYTVTIPESITIDPSTRLGSGNFMVNAGSLITAGTSIKFAITSATNYDDTDKFRLKNASGSNVFIKYAIKKMGDPEVDVSKDAFFLIASDTEAFAGKTEILEYTAEAPRSAGIYSDTVTISITNN